MGIDPVTANQLPRKMRDVPHPPKGYSAYSAYYFHGLKKRIISNAHAYYAQRFPKSKRLDFIISSTTPTGRLDGVEYQGALIVYHHPKSLNWKMLYKSNKFPIAEDAAFEVKYWLEEYRSAVFDKMDARDIWIPAATADGKVQAGAPKKKKKKKKTSKADKNMEDVQVTRGNYKSPNAVVGDSDGTGKVNKGKDKDFPKQPNVSILSDRTKAGADIFMLDLKRKSTAEDE